MIRLLSILFMLLSVQVMGQAELDRAKIAYSNEDYVLTQQILAADLNSTGDSQEQAILHYNLGNCSYRLGNLPMAIWHYRMCLLRAPGHREAKANLVLIEERLAGVGAQDSPPSLLASLMPLTTPESFPWLILVQALSLIGVIVLRNRNFLRFSLTMLLLTSVALAGFTWWQANQQGRPQAVVTSYVAQVHNEPHASLPATFTLQPGTVVEVKASSRRWTKITIGSSSGWVQTPNLSFLK